MGKADALEHLGDGLYRTRYILNREPIDGQIERLNAEKTQLETRRLELTLTLIPQASGARESALATLNSLIDTLDLSDPNYSQQLRDAGRAVSDAAIALQILIAEKEANELRQSEITQKIRDLENVTTEYEIEAWCADLSLELAESGLLGTIEVPGEIDPENLEIVLLPDQPNNQTGNASFKESRDGAMTPTLGMSAEAVTYALMMLPGWEAYAARYRFGRITTINANGTVDVVLEPPNTSSDLPRFLTSLDATPKLIETDEPIPLTGLEVVYMGCHVLAFDIGDQVVIDFTEANEGTPPKVIGFRHNPKPCSFGFLIETGSFDRPGNVGTWSFKAHQPNSYGNIYWKGASQTVSWRGLSPWIMASPGEGSASIFWGKLSSSVYSGNQVIAIDAPGLVIGAAVNFESGIKQLVVAVLPHSDADFDGGGRPENAAVQFWWKAYDGLFDPEVTWNLIGVYSKPETAGIRSTVQHFIHFSEDGKRAAYMQAGGKTLSGNGSTSGPFTTNVNWQYPIVFDVSGNVLSWSEDQNTQLQITGDNTNVFPSNPNDGDTHSDVNSSSNSGSAIVTQAFVGNTLRKATVTFSGGQTSSSSWQYVDFSGLWLLKTSDASLSDVYIFDSGGALTFPIYDRSQTLSAFRNGLGELETILDESRTERQFLYLNLAFDASVILRKITTIHRHDVSGIFTQTTNTKFALEFRAGGSLNTINLNEFTATFP